MSDPVRRVPPWPWRMALLAACHGVSLIALFSLFGCAPPLREASPESIGQAVKQSKTAAGNGFAWSGPELQVSHYRTLFYGYDKVYYRLLAKKPPTGGVVYQLWIDAHYGGDIRHYAAFKFANGSSRPAVGQRHDTERCQLFNNMVSACLFHDQASLELSPSDLDAARLDGLRLTLGSGSQDYETIDLPANYIQGFLAAIQ